MTNHVFIKIDELIKNVNNFKIEPIFSTELKLRQNKKVSDNFTENQIIELFTTIIAYSQNANSERVETIIKSGVFSEILADFNIDVIAEMNPCDLADTYWDKICGIRQQSKLFHIVSLARKIKKIGSFTKLLTETQIPREIKNENDIDQFWTGFFMLLKVMKNHKVPFFGSTTSLLHLLLEMGYDCAKPDLVVMKVAKKIGVVDKESGEKNFIKTIRTIQEYSLERKIKPAIVDLYFLIDEGQLGAKKFVSPEFYNK